MFRIVFLRAALAIVLVAEMTTGVSAQSTTEVDENYTAEVMYELCTDTRSDMPPDGQSLICTFRLQGVVEIMVGNCGSHLDGFAPAPWFSASPPPSRGAVRQAFVNHMEDHPEQWGLRWSTAVAFAVSEVFPCEME